MQNVFYLPVDCIDVTVLVVNGVVAVLLTVVNGDETVVLVDVDVVPTMVRRKTKQVIDSHVQELRNGNSLTVSELPTEW
jgi:hypothetical protein